MVELTEEQIATIIKACESLPGGARFIPYEERYENKVASSGTNTKTFSRVDPKRIRVITHVAAYNDTSACTFIDLKHKTGYGIVYDKSVPAPLIGETVNFDGTYIMGGGDQVEIDFVGCTSGDDLYAVASGYEILLN